MTAASRKISAVSRLASRPAVHTEAVLDGLAFMVERQADNLAYLREAGCPVYLVSYEKALRRPEAFIRQLADFIGIAAPEDVSDIAAYMAPESYKDASQASA